MKGSFKLLGIIFVSLTFVTPAVSQISPENLKTALVYRIANCVKWNADTATMFSIGILSDNQLLINRFLELSKTGRINNRHIRVLSYSDVNAIKATHLLYIDEAYNEILPEIIKQQSRQNCLIVTEEHTTPGDIMINLKLNIKKSLYTFEYNRANILFAGLDITDEIVLLKGSEIEIRELYLHTRKLLDQQQSILDELTKQVDAQNRNISLKNDSIDNLKNILQEYRLKITGQNVILTNKDSLSNNLNEKIRAQQSELTLMLQQTEKMIVERSRAEDLINSYQSTINSQMAVSDSLNRQITRKQSEIIESNKLLTEQKSVIQKQNWWLAILTFMILIVTVSVIIISRAYITNRRARRKIAEQKEELEKALEQLKSMQQQLIRSEKMASLGVFISGIAHEVNNPLNFISMGVESIGKVLDKVIPLAEGFKKLNPESNPEEFQELLALRNEAGFQRSIDAVPEILANIRTGIERTVSITNGLRIYARMDAEEKTPGDINQIIDSALILVHSQIKRETDIQKNYGVLPQAMVFPRKLSQVFMNILSNAVDSINSIEKQALKPSISITTRAIGGNIVIEFSDNGTGIPTEALPKIFDPFFTTKKEGRGTGLGMSVSAAIIEEHSGKITARNNNDAGSTFTIVIPIFYD